MTREDLDNNIHYLLGQLSMADELIEMFKGHARSKIGRQKLKELKDERRIVVNKIQALANKAWIYIPQDKGGNAS